MLIALHMSLTSRILICRNETLLVALATMSFASMIISVGGGYEPTNSEGNFCHYVDLVCLDLEINLM